jgi:hypothetical protein
MPTSTDCASKLKPFLSEVGIVMMHVTSPVAVADPLEEVEVES